MTFEKVEEFQYLGVLLSTKKDWSREISVRIAKAERASFALFKFLKPKAFLKKIKSRLYTELIRLSFTYVFEVWTTKNVIER